MTDEKEQFINDLKKCLNVADELSEMDMEDTKPYVSKQLQDLQRFLQDKQTDAEKRLDIDIAKEEKEIATLNERIRRAAHSDGTEESDLAYKDIGLLYEELYEDTRTKAFDAYIAETNDKVPKILDNLIDILKISYRHCTNKAKINRDAILFEVIYPGEDRKGNRNLSKEDKHLYPKFESSCKEFQKQCTPFGMPSIIQAMVTDVKTDSTLIKLFKSKPNVLSRSLDNYLKKCVEFSWIACLEEPEVKLITAPKKECKHISDKFHDLVRTTQGKDRAHVEWPAVVQDNVILSQWKLYTISQPRPEPKHLHEEQSKDYRALEVEGTGEGNELDADDDKHMLSGSATASNPADTDLNATDRDTNKQSTPEGKPNTHKGNDTDTTQEGRSQSSESKHISKESAKASKSTGGMTQHNEDSKSKGNQKRKNLRF